MNGNRRLDSPEIGTVLAALRLYQKCRAEGTIPENIKEISTDGGQFPALTDEQIEELTDSMQEWRLWRPEMKRRK